MDVSARPPPHPAMTLTAAKVLIIEIPGWALTRVAVERAVTTEGWGIALTPADADVVAVCGRPSQAWGPVIDRLCKQLPGPRARVHAVTAPQEAVRVFQGSQPGHESAGADDSGDRDHAGDPGHTDQSDDTGDDAVDTDMPMPGGIPLAGGDQDRDGLEMDVLTTPVGPVLPYWPAGLQLRCTLHGDLIADAVATAFPGADAGEYRRGDDVRLDAALDCDGIARLLALAGRGDAASSLCGIRNALLDGASTTGCSAAVDRWTDRLRRSRLLSWSVTGLGRIGEPGLSRDGLPAALAGDVRDRMLARLTATAQGLARAGAVIDPVDRAEASAAVLDLLPALVTGLELGAARLVVASVDPDIATLHRGSADG